MATRFANPFPRFFLDSGRLNSGGKLNFFEPGATTIRKDTFSDQALTTPNSNPVVLTESGVIPDIFLDGQYYVSYTTENDVIIDDADFVGEAATTFPTGTFTPQLNFGGNAVGIVYGIQSGNYQLSGTWCTCAVWFNLNSKGSSTGNATITGWPFPAQVSNSFEIGAPVGLALMAAPQNTTFGTFELGGTDFILRGDSNNLDDTDFSNTSVVVCNFAYPIVP